MSQPREQWGTRLGFVLAAAGSAIGLGAVWRLPYVAGTSGGGAFFLIFVAFTLILGTALLIAEFVVGRRTQKPPVPAYKTIAPNTPWFFNGIMGMICAILILSFYSVVGGWIIIYFVRSLGGLASEGTDYGALFGSIISNPWEVGIAHLAFMLITILVVQGGVRKGIERTTNWMMPALFILFIVIVIRSLTLEGAGEGIAFFLQPDFSAVTGTTILFALGQAFFSLSLGNSVMATYSSYLPKEKSLINSAFSIVVLTIIISLLSGLAIFPGVFAFDIPPDAGPNLIFIVLPAVFEQLALGSLFFTLFMLLLVFATLTSAFSLLEIIVSSVSYKRPDSRGRTAWVVGILIFILGIPSNLSYGLLSDWLIFGNTFFDSIDILTSNFLLPLGALIVSLFLPLKIKKADLRDEVMRGSVMGNGVFLLWFTIIRYIAPVAIIIVFINSLIGLFTGS